MLRLLYVFNITWGQKLCKVGYFEINLIVAFLQPGSK